MQNKLIKHFISLTGVDFHAFNVTTKEFDSPEDTFCNRCPKRCNYKNTHLYGCYESVRWDNQYIYYCPMDFIFIAVPIIGEFNVLTGGVIAGPILMGDPNDFEYSKNIPQMKTAQVNDLAFLASRVFVTRKGEVLVSTGNFLNTVYRELEQLNANDNHYPIDLEHRLQEAIIDGNESDARELLNRLLGEIFFRTNGDFNTIKTRSLELLVLLSRSAIEGGADPEQIFALNDNYMQEIENFDTTEKLATWLSGIINRFIGYVFEFGDIKHSVTLRKIIAYIRNNYSKKITLDDIAEHVYMSKSHISKIFNEELHVSISAYIRDVRVEKSKHLLCDPTLTIAQVANLTGFDDQSYFTKQFKVHTGISPKIFREKQNAHSASKGESKL